MLNNLQKYFFTHYIVCEVRILYVCTSLYSSPSLSREENERTQMLCCACQSPENYVLYKIVRKMQNYQVLEQSNFQTKRQNNFLYFLEAFAYFPFKTFLLYGILLKTGEKEVLSLFLHCNNNMVFRGIKIFISKISGEILSSSVEKEV